MSIDFERLRAANIARQNEWLGASEADIKFRLLELLDEAGEIYGALKKLIRARRGIQGTTACLEDVADEIADTVISLDLLACDLGCKLENLTPCEVPIVKGDLIELAFGIHSAVGELYEEVRLSGFTDVSPLGEYQMWAICGCLEVLATALDIDIAQAVTQKFNKTSEKYGLQTRFDHLEGETHV